jgi:hypothetical protein
MSNITKAVSVHLLSESAVTSICSTRIVIGALKQGMQLPALVVSKISDVPENHIAGPGSLSTARIQVDCFADTQPVASSLKDAVTNAMETEGVAVTWDSIEITESNLDDDSEFYEPPIDGSDKPRFRVSLDFMVSYYRS